MQIFKHFGSVVSKLQAPMVLELNKPPSRRSAHCHDCSNYLMISYFTDKSVTSHFKSHSVRPVLLSHFKKNYQSVSKNPVHLLTFLYNNPLKQFQETGKNMISTHTYFSNLHFLMIYPFRTPWRILVISVLSCVGIFEMSS